MRAVASHGGSMNNGAKQIHLEYGESLVGFEDQGQAADVAQHRENNAIRGLRDDLGIDNWKDGGRIDDDQIVFLSDLVQQLLEVPLSECPQRCGIVVAGRDQPQPVDRSGLDRFANIDLAPQRFAEAVPVFQAEDLVQRGSAHVAIDQQGAAPAAGEAGCKV